MVAMKSPSPTGKPGAGVPQGPLLKGPSALTRSRGHELCQRGQGPQRCAKPPSLSLGTHVVLEGVGATLPSAGPPGLLWGPAPGPCPARSPALPAARLAPSHPQRLCSLEPSAHTFRPVLPRTCHLVEEPRVLLRLPSTTCLTDLPEPRFPPLGLPFMSTCFEWQL